MKRKLRLFWNGLPLFWKTFVLSMTLAVSVVIIGEVPEDLIEDLFEDLKVPISSNLQEAALWLIAIVASSLAGSLVLSRIVTGALTRIQPVIEHLSEGELDSRVTGPDLERGDEIGSLGRSFNKMADSLSALLESEQTLIRDISHEMRSPLTRMKMALALLAQDLGEPSEAVDSYIKQIEKDIDRMENMVGQMLERARLEGMGNSGLEKNMFDLTGLVETCVADHSLNASAGDKRILVERSEGVTYWGNEMLLRRALDNLIKNALHYTAAGTAVTVHLHSAPGFLMLAVSDHGPGIPEDHLENIFRPFYRVDSARDRNSGGFGLGLAIARQAAELHGGHLTAANIQPDDSGRPGGLKMTLALPLVCAPSASE